MSHKADKERAESGLIFRNGRLVRKEDWYGTHPISKVVELPDPEPILDLQPYFCGKCQRRHNPGSKIYSAHIEHKI